MQDGSLFSVSGQGVLVSGGSRGIGRELAQAFAARGARVFISGRDPDTLAATAEEISIGEHAVRWVTCDVSSVEAIRSAVGQVLEELGQLDTLLNVAGVNIRQPADRFTPEQFDFVMDINLRGAFLMAQAVGKHLCQRGQGSIVNIDSLNSAGPLKSVTPYAMSKCGLNGMTRCWPWSGDLPVSA